MNGKPAADRDESTNLVPRMGFDLRELELRVVWIHQDDLLLGRRAEDFDNFDELVDATFAGEEGVSKK